MTQLNENYINMTLNAPVSEPERQHYFIGQAKTYVSALEKKYHRKPTACITTFGCQMNARDSEKLAGILLAAGFSMIDDESADFVLFNTCTVRDHANQRVYGRLGKLKSLKKKNPQMKIALCGCMMQEDAVIEKIKQSYHFVDLIFGTHNIFKFAELLVAMLNTKEMVIDIWQETDKIVEDLPIERKYPFKSGINIMFGCNNFCTYCIVPYVRGRERSRPAEDIIAEIKRLVADGVTEIMLLGQNVNSYGLTESLQFTAKAVHSNNDAHKSHKTPRGITAENSNAKSIDFPGLLREIEKIDGLKRIRFMTSHPKDLSDDLIKVMKESSKICRHLHLPIQAGSTRILELMNRGYTKEDYLNLIFKIRENIPDIAITTDIIVGFPGETSADFAETIDVVNKVKFDNAFTFIYSKRTGTPAATMPDQVPEEEVKENFAYLLKTVQEIARTRVGRLTGETHSVLVEEINDNDPELLSGRLSNNTLVHFKGEPDLIGTIIDVELTEAKGFYYIGKIAPCQP
ncbi:MAG: MiaB/RimO family radical SAM methylthiotransferase [Lachnospiraceae bacterium]|nr:MiaB/RimO family radical SAM methylthiotransferase [Lachnospiraceae bacterium]